jgi:hypothetical protein
MQVNLCAVRGADRPQVDQNAGMLRRSIVGLGVALVYVAALAGPAGAARLPVLETTFFPDPPVPGGGDLFILKDSPTAYLVSGGVDSKRGECESLRTIRLHVIQADGTDTVIASKQTKRSRLFNFRVPLVPGESVYVTTPAKQAVIRSGKRVRCAAGRSNPQPVS